MQLPTSPACETDLLYRGLADDPPLRVVALVATRLVREAAERHDLSGPGAVALGRGLVCGLLMATLTKSDERVTLQVTGEGALRTVTVDANDLGQVRGYVSLKAGGASPGPGPEAVPGRLSLAPLFGGEGLVVVHRDLGLRDLYQGSIPLAAGEVDVDLERYLRDSEQMPSVLRAAVLLQPDGRVAFAGGLLVQTTPGAPPESLDGIAAQVAAGWVERELPVAQEILPPLEDLLDQPVWILEWRQVQFHCPCDAGRVASALRTLGAEDLRKLLAEAGRAEVTCRYCGAVHEVDGPTLARLADALEAEAAAGADPDAEAESDGGHGPPPSDPSTRS